MYKTIYRINQKGVYHLDIKPDNILLRKVNNEIEFKFIDFGHTYFEQNNSVSFHLFLYNTKSFKIVKLLFFPYFV